MNPEQIFDSPAIFKLLFESSPVAIAISSLSDGTFSQVNDAFLVMHGYTRNEVIGHTSNELQLWNRAEGRESVVAQLRALRATEVAGASGKTLDFAHEYRHKSGRVGHALVSARIVDLNGSECMLGFITGVDQHVEQALKEEIEKNTALLRHASDGVHILDREGHVVDASDSFCAMLGYSRDEVIGMNARQWDDKFAEQELLQVIRQQMDNPARSEFETLHRRKDGSVFPVEVSGIPLKIDGETLLYNSSRDISKRKAAQQALQENLLKLAESESHFRSVIEHSPSGIYVTLHDLIVYANPRLCEILRLPQESLLGCNSLEVFLKGEEVRRQVEQNRETLRKTGEVHYLEASYKRPDGTDILIRVHGAVGLWDGEKAIVAMVEDVTEQARAEAKIADYVKLLEGSMRETLQAVANMVEMRDPYTAGHERRVGIIAADIAREMGWPEDKCDMLALVGLVHDIGKIAIPAEMLTKPSRLSAVEYQIVQTHAEQGYQILKDVHFSLPIADIIRQHHERPDGSGYPQGLKGDQILLEARILAVADALESILSHRPFRPAQGMAVAMQEFEQHRGTWFDADVVDTITRMVRDKGYQLPS